MALTLINALGLQAAMIAAPAGHSLGRQLHGSGAPDCTALPTRRVLAALPTTRGGVLSAPAIAQMTSRVHHHEHTLHAWAHAFLVLFSGQARAVQAQ